MTFDLHAIAAASNSATGTGQGSPVQAGYGFSMTDAGGFEQAMQNSQVLGPQVSPATMSSEVSLLMTPLAALDKQRVDMRNRMKAISEPGGGTITALLTTMADIGAHSVNVTFISSISKAGTEGIQQLFRQQS